MSKPKSVQEMDLVDQFLRDYRIGATIARSRSYVGGKSFISFALTLGAGTRIASIEYRLRELAEVLSQHRGQATPVRLRQMPLALELPHPDLEPLYLPDAMRLEAHTMALGMSYGFAGEQIETVSLAKVPHVLIAGTTGSGKSTLLSAALSTLMANTSPAELRLVLVDLKNEDLQPFVGLPHVEMSAMTPAAAIAAVQMVLDEKDERVRGGRKSHQRLVLVIDELAELSRLKGVGRSLSSILAIGRSKSINVIAATQHPMASAVGGSTTKANFTLRLVGRVLSADDAKVAAGQGGTGAEFLPGRGSFLRVDGADVRRFQAYYLEDVDERMARVRDLWYQQLSFELPAVERMAA